MKFATLTYDHEHGWSAPFPPYDSSRTLLLVFGFSALVDDPSPLAPLLAHYPLAQVMGCSTAGEIAGTTVHDDTISVAIVRFDGTELRSASAIMATPADCAPAGRELGQLLAAPDLAGIFVLSDGLNVNGTDLLRGLNERIDPKVVVTGGLAGDGPRFRRTWVVENRRLRRHRVVALGVYGRRVRVGHGSHGGWDTFGAAHAVTRSDGNVLYEIDGKAALRLYKEHLGALAGGLPASALLCPLNLRRGAGTEPVVRTILAVDEATQSMTFAGDIPQGSTIEFMRANLDRLIAGADLAARQTGMAPDDGVDSLAIAISCVGSRLVLGPRAVDEVSAVSKVLPRGGGLLGFYSYGEISPHASGRCELHNQTMTLTQFSERRSE
jgi:hypothetical protein